MKRIRADGKVLKRLANPLFTTAHTQIIRFADKSHHPAELSPEEKEEALQNGYFITQWRKLRETPNKR